MSGEEKYFGSGPALDEGLDFTISPTGDLSVEQGYTELQKDLAFQLKISLQSQLGSQPTRNAEVAALTISKEVVEADERVESFIQERASASFDTGGRRITLNIPVQTITGERFEFVYEI